MKHAQNQNQNQKLSSKIESDFTLAKVKKIASKMREVINHKEDKVGMFWPCDEKRLIQSTLINKEGKIRGNTNKDLLDEKSQ